MTLGDDEHRISIGFEATERGEHVHVRVRTGLAGMRALAGELVLRREEWLVLRDNLTYSEPINDKIAASMRYAPHGATSHLEGVRIVHFDTSPIEITEASTRERDAALFARLDESANQLAENQ